MDAARDVDHHKDALWAATSPPEPEVECGLSACYQPDDATDKPRDGPGSVMLGDGGLPEVLRRASSRSTAPDESYEPPPPRAPPILRTLHSQGDGDGDAGDAFGESDSTDTVECWPSETSFEERDRRLREVEHWRLQEQLRAESMFVSYVFHEMRNPYNGIAGHLSCIEETLRGCTRALERGGGAEGAALASLTRSVANMVDDCAAATLCSQHMSDVLNNVLDLRRIEEGAMTLEPAPFDVAALVRDTSRMVCPRDSVLVRQSASEGGRELQAFHCCGDALRLRQVLQPLSDPASELASTSRCTACSSSFSVTRSCVAAGSASGLWTNEILWSRPLRSCFCVQSMSVPYPSASCTFPCIPCHGVYSAPLRGITTACTASPSGDEQDACAMACLLYTSPSPRDATLSRMPSSA